MQDCFSFKLGNQNKMANQMRNDWIEGITEKQEVQFSDSRCGVRSISIAALNIPGTIGE